MHLIFSPTQLQGEKDIWQIAQAPDGQMIMSGERISYYDQGRWEVLTEPRKEAIRGLLVDGETLWVASPNELGSIALPLGKQSRYEQLKIPALASAGEIWHLAKIGQFLIATTKDDLWFVDPKAAQAQRINLPSDHRLVMFWLGTKLVVIQPGVACWEVKDGSIGQFANPLPDTAPTSWRWGTSDFLITSTQLYKKTNGTYYSISDSTSIAAARIVTATPWDKHLAISTLEGGIALADAETGGVQFISRAMGLPALATLCCFTDRDGRLWVGTTQGIAVFESLRYGHKIAAKEYPQAAARTSQGVLISYEDRAIFHPNEGDDEALPIANGLIPTSHGLAIGFWGGVRVGPKVFRAGTNTTYTIAELPNGNLLAEIGEQLFQLDWKLGRSEQIASPKSVFSSLVSIADTVWGATYDGNLYRAQNTPPFSFTRVAALPDTASTALRRVGSTLILASRDGVRAGLNFQPVGHTIGLRNPRIAENDDGVWMIGDQDSTRRLGRLRAEGDQIVWDPMDVKGLSQLSEVHSFTANAHSLVFCGDSTIIELDAREAKAPVEPGTPQIAFTWHDPDTGAGIVGQTPPTELAAANNSFSFSGWLKYDEFGEKPRLERRLLPTETDWAPAQLGETVGYPSLSSRTYTLEVRATRLGRTGSVSSYTFTVLPPWYATQTAFAGYLACAAVGFYGLYRLRTHQLHRRTERLERLVSERTHALEEASAAKTEFLASMSHEIRNPMNGVLGLVEILREQPATARQAGTLRMLHHCAEQLRSTVDDILDFSKIEAGRVALDSSRFDLQETLEAAAATVDSTGEKVTFLEKPPPGTTLIGDVGKLRQIFANYLSNALKYGVPPSARVSTLLTPDDGRVRLTLSVASFGPTIPKDTLDKFFDSFTRGQQAIERNIHGTGLGLAICKRFATAMGGEVGAVSANGETTFYLNVPFAHDHASAPAPPPAIPAGMLPARALAIEDEDYNRVVLGSILAKMNYTVDWATTGEEALRKAQENGYDIILTDYRLPDTNGVDLTRKILQFCPDPKPAVFAVTAYSTKERREECMNAGMAGFISKPITLEKLRANLATWGEQHLTRISLESSRPAAAPDSAGGPPPDVTTLWTTVKGAAATNPKEAANLAHKLNNVCRTHGLIDLAEQLELLEGALERGEPTEPFLRACEEFLRP